MSSYVDEHIYMNTPKCVELILAKEDKLKVSFNIPKSRSLNFDTGIGSNSLKEENRELKSKLSNADLELESLHNLQGLTRTVYRLEVLKNNDNKIQELNATHRTRLENERNKAEERANILKKEIEMIKKTNQELIEENNKMKINAETQEMYEKSELQSLLKDEQIEFEHYKNNALNRMNLKVIDKIVLIKLESLCELSYAQKRSIDRLKSEHSITTKDLNERLQYLNKERSELTELLCNCNTEKTNLEKTNKELSYNHSLMEKIMEKQDVELKLYDKVEQEKLCLTLKSIFKEFNECIEDVKEISTEIIQKENRNPYPSALMKKEHIFKDLDQTVFKALDLEFLNEKVEEMSKLRNALKILKLDLGIKNRS